MRLDDTTLTRAIHEGMMRMDAHRTLRARLAAEIAGPYYGRGDVQLEDHEKRPVNVLAEMVHAYLAQLVGNQIRPKVSNKTGFLRGEARMRQYMLEDWCREINLARSVRLCVLDALIGGMGIMRVGNRSGKELCHIEGKDFDVGEIYAARVDMDDYCRDPISRDESEDRWRAYRYRVDRETALMLWPEAEETLLAVPKVSDNLQTEHESGLMQLSGAAATQDWTTEVIELWDWFAYKDGQVLTCTLAGTTSHLRKLGEVHEYEGYEGGPLHLLSFRSIPNNAQPIPICGQLLDMHEAMANTSSKMIRQIMTAKTAYVVRDGASETTALEMRDAVDQSIFMGDPNSIATMEVGGVIQKLYQGFDWLRAESNNASGAASLIAGQSDVSKTATGASYMAGQANIRLNDMKGQVQKFTADVLSHAAWYHDNHPALRQTFNHKLPQGAGSIDVVYDSAAKEGEFGEFHFECIPVSESMIDPNVRLARITGFMQVAPAFVQMVAAFGGNVQAAIQQLGEVFDWPELGELFPTQEALMMAQAMMQAKQPGQGMMAPQAGAYGQRPAAPSATGGPINQIQQDRAAAQAPMVA